MGKGTQLNTLYAKYGIVTLLLFFAMAGQPVAAKDGSAIHQLIERAESGDAEAQHELGLKYRDGEGVKQSDDQAAKWLIKAYKKGKNYDAAVDLGDMYIHGRGFNTNFFRDTQSGEHRYRLKARNVYRKAVANGSTRAKFRLAAMYTPSTMGDGLIWYEDWKISKQKYPREQMQVSPKFRRAEKLFREAAEDGHAEAQYTLGRVYAEFNFGSGSEARSVKYYTAAAMQGHFFASYDLAVMYAQGKLISVNLPESYAWFSLARHLTDEMPASEDLAGMQAGLDTSLKAVRAALEPADLAVAQRLVRERLPAIEQSVIVL